MLFWARIFFASFDLPLQWIIWDSPKIGSNNLKRMEDWISNFLKDHLPADLFVQFKNSNCLHFEQEKQLYRLYHTPSFSGSRRKQKHFLVPLTLSQTLRECSTLSTKTVCRFRRLKEIWKCDVVILIWKYYEKLLQNIPNTLSIQYLYHTRRHRWEREHHLKKWVGFVLLGGWYKKNSIL